MLFLQVWYAAHDIDGFLAFSSPSDEMEFVFYSLFACVTSITGLRRKPYPGLSLRLCFRWLSMDHCLSQYPWPIGWPIAHAVQMEYACFVTLDTVLWPQIQAAWCCDNQWGKCLIECCSLVGALLGEFGFHGFKWAEKLYPYPYYYKSSQVLIWLILFLYGLLGRCDQLRCWDSEQSQSTKCP